MSHTTLVIGATSAMAERAARRFAADGDRLLLAGRDRGLLDNVADDLRVRGASEVKRLPTFDALDPESLTRLIDAVERGDTVPDRILIAHGTLPNPDTAHHDPDAAARALDVNFTSVVRLCTPLAALLERNGGGTLAVVSSVAGLRGRQSNYIYGAAKGGLILYLQGLRNRLHPAGVRVLTLLPGFVDTPMTGHVAKGPLFVSAETAGRLIHRAITRGRGDVAYIPFFWRPILWIIRAIPEPLFKRLKL